jgi:GT2 family glycosyltransferase
LAALARQTHPDFDIVIVDNSGSGRVRRDHKVAERSRIIENPANVGFGAAANQGFRASNRPFVAVLNDDTAPRPQWLEMLTQAITSDARAGMCASRVLFAGSATLDSAGMLIARDGSSKQRGHGEPAERYSRAGEALLPSGAAALYRRAMLDEIGMFEESYFLYCEDTDIGLRARWAGWLCLYVPEAVVEHRYSQSAGRASALKAWYVERNRLFTVVRNFPGRALVRLPAATVARYLWHLWFAFTGRGTTAEYVRQASTFTLAGIVIRAHCATVMNLRGLLRERRRIRRSARLSAREFVRLLDEHRISAREVAAL